MLPQGVGSTSRHYPQRMVPFPREGKHFHQKTEADTRQYLSVQGKEATNIKLLIQKRQMIFASWAVPNCLQRVCTSISASGCVGEGNQKHGRPTEDARLSGLRPLVIWLKRSPRRKETGHLSTGDPVWAKLWFATLSLSSSPDVPNLPIPHPRCVHFKPLYSQAFMGSLLFNLEPDTSPCHHISCFLLLFFLITWKWQFTSLMPKITYREIWFMNSPIIQYIIQSPAVCHTINTHTSPGCDNKICKSIAKSSTAWPVS